MLKNVFGRKDFMYAWFSGKKIFLLAEKTFILFLLVEFVLEHTHNIFNFNPKRHSVYVPRKGYTTQQEWKHGLVVTFNLVEAIIDLMSDILNGCQALSFSLLNSVSYFILCAIWRNFNLLIFLLSSCIRLLHLLFSSALCFMWLFGRMPLNTYFLPLCIVQGLIYLWFFTPLLEMRPQYLSTQLLTWSRQDYHIRQW